jgi:hypothetical protein
MDGLYRVAVSRVEAFMKVAWSVLVSVVLLQGRAFAQIQAQPQPQTQTPAPEIEVVDGKVSMSALGMPLSRVVSLLDRAMNMKSKVAPEVASRPISVRFKDLPLKDAVQKIFEGQPLNYSLIAGKGIEVSGAAIGTASTGPSFQDPLPVSQTPIPGVTPIQPAVPINPAGVPVQVGGPTGGAANPQGNNPAATGGTAPPPGVAAPGQLPTPIGGVNPLTQPVSATPSVGFPPATPPPQQPSGPGTVGGALGGGGATPGTITTPGQIPR